MKKLTQAAVIAAMFASTALPMMAQAEVLSATDQAKLCQEMQSENTELVKKLNEAKADADKRQALLIEALKNPNNSFCIMTAVTTGAPTIAKVVLQQILAILAKDPKNDDIIKKLTELYSEMLASIDTDIEPAGGPDFGDPDTGLPENPGENPNQLNPNPDGDTPPSSPSQPLQ